MNATAKWVLIGVGAALLISLFFGLISGPKGVDFGWTPPLFAVFVGVITAFIGLNLSGNRREVAVAPMEAWEAVETVLPPGQGRLIVYREGVVGSMAGMNLSVDGQEVAQLKSPRFTVVRLAPGEHRLTAGFGGLAKAQNHAAQTEFVVREGQSVVYRAVVGMGLIRNTIRLERQDDLVAVGSALANSRMVKPDQEAV